MPNTWNQSGTTWSEGRWGTQDPITQGWGADPYNDAASTWGDVSDEIVSLTAPDAITSKLSIGSSFGDGAWGQEQGWGQFVLNISDVMGLTGVSATSSVGRPTGKSDYTRPITGQSATVSVGSITPADVMGVTGLSATSAVGSISPADVMGLTGVSATSSVGSATVTSNPTIAPTGLAMTSALGSLSPADVMGLTGVSTTFSVGSIAPADVMGLTGQSVTSSVAGFGVSTGFGIQAYQAVDTGSNISYSNVATGTNITYSDVA